MKKTLNLEELYREYAALATELSTLKWVSHGYALKTRARAQSRQRRCSYS